MHRAKVSYPRNCGKLKQPIRRTKCGLLLCCILSDLQMVATMERRKEKLRDRIISCFLFRNRSQRAPFWAWKDLCCGLTSSLVKYSKQKKTSSQRPQSNPCSLDNPMPPLYPGSRKQSMTQGRGDQEAANGTPNKSQVKILSIYGLCSK